MNFGLYMIIFITKIIENALGTLRVIVIANRKKFLGAFLNGLIALIWLVVTGMVIINVTQDPIKILFFCLGSIVGSYLGSLMEENLALGNNLLMAIVDYKIGDVISMELRKSGYAVTVSNGCGKDQEKSILFVMTTRKKTQECVSLISCLDIHALIVSENANAIYGGYHVY